MQLVQSSTQYKLATLIHQSISYAWKPKIMLAESGQ